MRGPQEEREAYRDRKVSPTRGQTTQGREGSSFSNYETQVAETNHFYKDDHMNISRLPVGWEYLVNHQLGGTDITPHRAITTALSYWMSYRHD
jgi:aryl-phospho-beta-D-glucosidase BglC (GH1 family)